MPSLTARSPALLPLACALACALALALPTGASAFQIGLQDDAALINVSDAQRALALNRARAIGVTWIKLTVVHGGYRQIGLEPYDRAVDAARKRGMTVHMLLTGSPAFLHGDPYLTYYRPSYGRFATFAASVARHFKGRVQYYSLWNEPNLALYLSPHTYAPSIFRNLFRAGYYAIKRVDPAAQVLFGEMAPGGGALAFLNAVVSHGPVVADGWAHHPYQLNLVRPGNRETRYLGISNVGLMRANLLRLARARLLRTPTGAALPIYFTEFGYPRLGAYYGYFNETIRASWTLAAFRLAKLYGARTMVWYQLYRQPGRPSAHVWDTGLLGTDGYALPVYRALLAARASLTGF